jgi:hypothetical protein
VLEVLKASGDPVFTDSPLTVESLLRTNDANPAIAKTAKKFAKFLRRAAQTNALFTLIYEALGRTDDKYKWIELTDGGHFENLGHLRDGYATLPPYHCGRCRRRPQLRIRRSGQCRS